MVGFAGAVGTSVPIGATYIYRLNFFSGFIVSAIIYFILCNIWPVPALSPTGKWFEVGDQIRNPSLVYGADAEEAMHEISQQSSANAEQVDEKKWWRIRQKS